MIYSRRMVRDKAKADRDRENGKGGGNPKLIAADNAGVNPPDKAQILEARNKKEKDTACAVSTAKKYAFECGIICLTQKDFDQWKAAYSQLDLAAELTGLREWAGKQEKNWFHAVSGALTKRNREVKLAKEKPGKSHNDEFWKGRPEGVY